MAAYDMFGIVPLRKTFEGWQKGLFDCFEQVQELMF
jgi:hypothetical protein